MSNDDDIEGLRRSGRARALLVVAALAVFGLAAWLLLRPSGHGEPELPHRVLIVGGLESDLAAAVAPAGFDADQRGWPTLEAELGSPPDYDALMTMADAGGYGFLAIVFDDTAPWALEALDAGSELPADTEIVVTSIGRMRPEGETKWSAGTTFAELEYPEGTRRPEALRVALYNHPDLDQFWNEPTPEQRTWRTPIARLPIQRDRLAARSEKHAQALASWPENFPPDSIQHPWLELSAQPLAGGLLFERRVEKLRLNSGFIVQQDMSPYELVWVSTQDAKRPGATAEAPILDTSATAERPGVMRSPNGRFFAIYLEAETRFELWSVDPGESPKLVETIGYSARLRNNEHNEITHEVLLSNQGEVFSSAWRSFSIGADKEFGLEDRLEVENIAWSGELAVANLRGPRRAGCGDCESLVFIDAQDALPQLLTIDLDALVNLPANSDQHASVHRIVSSNDAVYVLIGDRVPRRRKLVKLNIPKTALSELYADPELAVSPEELWTSRRRAWLTNAQFDASTRSVAELRELPGTEIQVVAQLSEVRDLFVSPAGDYLAWTADEDLHTLYIAPITEAGLGEAKVVSSEHSHWDAHTYAGFTTDSAAFVLNSHQARSGLPSPADFVRLIAPAI